MSKPSRKQVNLRVEPGLYRSLEATARRERRSVPQVARLLIEEGLRHRAGVPPDSSDLSSADIAVAAASGGAFDWLADEQDLYDDSRGEAV